MRYSYVHGRIGWLLSLLLLTQPAAQAADGLGANPAGPQRWGDATGQGYYQTATTGRLPGGGADAQYGERYRGSTPVAALPRASAPWHRLVDRQQAGDSGGSSRSGTGYRAVSPSAIVPSAYPLVPSGYAPLPRTRPRLLDSSYYSQAPGVPGPQGTVGGYGRWQRTPGGVSGGLGSNTVVGTDRVRHTGTTAAVDRVQVMNYNDYTAIPEKPPSGMPKPGIDFIAPVDE